jgi:hypothetical protein
MAVVMTALQGLYLPHLLAAVLPVAGRAGFT